MLRCGQCDFENDVAARYCEVCGVALRCPSCHATIGAGRNFCRECGKPLPALRTALAQVRTPRHLAEQFLGSSSSEGENKIVTLLFADVANSTALIRDLKAEEANRILEPTLDLMMEAVARYEGTVTQTPGDSIMAIFGAPIAHEDHAVRACHAALDIQEAIRVLAAEMRQKYGVHLQVRIGINSGQVLAKVKYQGGDAFVDYRAVGLTTHVASRLQALAAPGTIVLSRDTFALAKGFIRVGPFESVNVKGIEAPIEVCELHGINTRMRIQARAARGLSKFVGRTVEMGMLDRAARQTQEGRGQIIAFVGEAGIGKSRVSWEFTRSSAMRGWLVLDAGSVSYGKATSYLPLVDLMSAYFDIRSRDDERQVREKVSAKLFALGGKKLVEHMPLFLGALGWGASDEAWANLAPAQRQRELFNALKELLIRESEQQPLCLVFEDLHWIDAETQIFLDTLVESVPAARILLLVNFRPEYSPVWANRSSYAQARIHPLTQASAGELLEALLGRDPALEGLKKKLVDLTKGNPLFLEEYVRSLIESGGLAGGTGDWRPTGTLLDLVVPQSIEALVASRIDRLEPRCKEVLQCAAVIGNDVPQSLLGAVLALPADDLEQAMHELQEAEFVYEAAVLPETEYTFKHSTTREVAYHGLLEDRKKALHARIARAMVRLSAGGGDEHVERVAEHAVEGELWELAVEYLQRAGEKAFGLYANAEAEGYFDRALEALRHVPESRATREQAVDLRFELRNTLIALCKLDRIEKCLQEVEPILPGLGDKQRSARYAAFRCNQHFLAGEQRRAIAVGEAGLALAREIRDRRLEGELLYRLGQSHHLLGDSRGAKKLFEQSIATTLESREGSRFQLSVIPAVVNRTWLAIALAECGEFRDGVAHAKRALEIAEAAEHPLSQVLGWLAVGSVLQRKCELDGAIGALERGMALSDRYALPIWRLRLLSSLGLAYAYSTRSLEGLRMTREALAGAEKMHLRVDQPMLLVNAGQASFLAGQFDDALAHGRRAIEFAAAHEDKSGEAWARFLVGRTRAADDARRLDEAVTQLESALRLAAMCDAKPLAAFCRSVLGSVYARRGESAKAQEFSAAANVAYAELDMRPLPLAVAPT